MRLISCQLPYVVLFEIVYVCTSRGVHDESGHGVPGISAPVDFDKSHLAVSPVLM